MSISENHLEIVRMLADGVDPNTGELLPDSSPLQDASTIRALHFAIDAIEYKIKFDLRKEKLPLNAGKRWSEEEDRLISEAFTSGKNITEISKNYGRTRGSIQSRLVKLGVIELPPNIETKEELVVKSEGAVEKPAFIEKNLEFENGCVDCGCEISNARLKASSGSKRCVPCQEKVEKKNPLTIKRNVDEGIAGTREDHKRMWSKYDG